MLFAARTATPYLIDQPLWEAIRRGSFADLPQGDFAELVRAEILVAGEENELRTILDDNDRAVAGDRCLYLVVQPSAWCQLGCAYCGQAHQRRQLGSEDQDRLVRRTREHLQGGRYDRLEVCWFGGEPLAGLNVMRSLTRRFRELTAQLDCRYTAKIVTNGLALTAENRGRTRQRDERSARSRSRSTARPSTTTGAAPPSRVRARSPRSSATSWTWPIATSRPVVLTHPLQRGSRQSRGRHCRC